VEYYGDEISPNKDRLKVAGYQTHAMLACRWSPTENIAFQNFDGDHAEDQILADRIWRSDIPAAIGSWTDQNPAPMVVTLAINRSPCDRCAGNLAHALHDLHNRFALRTPQQHFLLAMRGYYESQKFMQNGKYEETTVTTTGGLKLLKDAGWKLCVLLFDNETSALGSDRRKLVRQRGLLQALRSL
jgi:hypothetical protein